MNKRLAMALGTVLATGLLLSSCGSEGQNGNSRETILELAQRENDEARAEGRTPKWHHLFLDFDVSGRAIVYSNADNPYGDLSDLEGAFDALNGCRLVDFRTSSGATLVHTVEGADVEGEILAVDSSESRPFLDFGDGSVFVCRSDYESLQYTIPMRISNVRDIAYAGHVDGFDFELIED